MAQLRENVPPRFRAAASFPQFLALLSGSQCECGRQCAVSTLWSLGPKTPPQPEHRVRLRCCARSPLLCGCVGRWRRSALPVSALPFGTGAVLARAPSSEGRQVCNALRVEARRPDMNRRFRACASARGPPVPPCAPPDPPECGGRERDPGAGCSSPGPFPRRAQRAGGTAGGRRAWRRGRAAWCEELAKAPADAAARSG